MCAQEHKTRGIADVCIVCCEGLTGLPGAITRRPAAGHRPAVRGAPRPRLAALCVRALPGAGGAGAISCVAETGTS
jgi:hypothetical protein